MERVCPCSEEREVSCPRGATRGAPKSAVCRAPLGRGPAPIEEGSLWPVGTGCRTSEEADVPVPSRFSARCSEERRLPGPVEVQRPVLRRAPFASPRYRAEPLILRRGFATLPRWNLTPGAPKSAACHVPVAGSPYPEGRGTGVRGRGFDAVMLRSAEADPHVTEHSLAAVAEASVTAV